VSSLALLARDAHGELAGGESLVLGYSIRDEAVSEEEMVAALEGSRGTDVARGGTSVGPHRDDLAIEVGGRDARLFGSQGQQRTATISIKLGSLELAQKELGMPPLLLLDDIFSDLDARRRSLLVERVSASAGQVVLTCTEASAAGESLLKAAKVFNVRAGEVHEA
jgi:DNA replication and repair protein RecF